MSRKTTYLVSFASFLAVASAPIANATPVQVEAPHLTAPSFTGPLASRTTLIAAPPRHLSKVSWWGGTYAVPDGEQVSIHISAGYPEADALAREWADFFGGIPHGKELSLAQVYIAPLAEVEELCSSEDVLGCYGGQTLVMVGDSTAGVQPASIAAHEYGHHVAANRVNTPWLALDWGTKRWATQAGICSRVGARTAFPGDEGLNYSLNPGEAFAEAYRVLVETHGTALGYDWPIVDPSFRPDAPALAAVQDDVLHPWSASTTKTIRGQFLHRHRTWTMTVATPLDGDLRIRVAVPGGGGDDVTLLSTDGRTVLARSSWDGSGGKAAGYRVCGARSVRVRVTRGPGLARFSLRVVAP